MTLPQTRKDSYELSAWDLSELPDEGVVDSHLESLEQLVETFEAQRASLDEHLEPAQLLEWVRQYEIIVEKMSTIGASASLWFASDTQSEAALTYLNRIQQTLTTLQNRILFFSVWWRNLEEEEAGRLMEEAGSNQDYSFFLRNLRRFRPYTLDEKCEQVINLKDADGIDAVVTLYSLFTNRFEFTLEAGGETLTLNRDRLTSYVYSSEASLREAAYRELYRKYASESKILAQMYANRVRDWHNENVNLRGFSSAIGVRNVVNDIADQAVETLLKVTRENSDLFQRYFRMKASWLGQSKLRRYDIYAPLTASERQVAYDDAVRLVLETFAEFRPELATNAERVFNERHIDSEIRPGKKAGGFCSTVLPSLTPWVLINYTGRVRDVATLAHELGHAIHSMLSEHHSVLTHHASLPLAETASVFAEMLVTDRLLLQEDDAAARRELLASAVEDIYATVMRQAYFVLFEVEAHKAILENRSPEELQELYLENLRQQFGDSLEIGDEFRYEWLCIPHIYSTPFYCYSYSFGQLLVLALYRRYQEEGERFKPLYLKLLAYGGSARPEEILGEAGIDVNDPGFWRGGFQIVRDMIDQIEQLDGLPA